MNWTIIFTILVGVVPGILKKKVLNDLTISEYFVAFSICMSCITIGLFTYKTYVKKEKLQLSKVFNNAIFPIFATLVIFKAISIYYKLGFLKKMNVSKYTPIFKSLSIVMTVIVGILFLGEKVSIKDMFGIGLVIGGVFLLSDENLITS